jgi:hypothetical protein
VTEKRVSHLKATTVTCDFRTARDEAKETFGDLNITNTKTDRKSVFKTTLGAVRARMNIMC